MKKILFMSMLALTCHLSVNAQSSAPVNGTQGDTTVFKGYIYNSEYQVYIDMDFYHNNILVPNQEIFGQLPGYFGAIRDSRKWLFTDAEITSKKEAKIAITNDYGSEDLTATLTQTSDSTFTLKQEEGSTLKIAVNRKWVKIPKQITFVRRTTRVYTRY